MQDLIDKKDFDVHYQPIVCLDTNTTFAYEALVRARPPEYKNPMKLLAAAVEQSLVGTLGRTIRQKAVDDCNDMPLFLNIHPNEFDEQWLVRPDDPIFLHEEPVYLEVTEAVPLSRPDLCHGVLREIRGKGLFLAVDDLGAGYSNLKYIADLEPEVVKLDRELISGLEAGTRLYTLVTKIVELCDALGAKVVAEGIETEDELFAVRGTGCHFAQGYFLARPAFPPPKPRRIGLEPPRK